MVICLESEVFIVTFYDDDEQFTANPIQLYQLRVHRGWFRGKNVFTQRLYDYERQFLQTNIVNMRINAGNMIT